MLDFTNSFDYVDIGSLDLAKPNVRLCRINPDQAEQVLTKYNWHNRNPRFNRAAGYARDMENDRWVFNGATICFAIDPSDGKVFLADGQNRLKAQIMANVSMGYLVVTGLSDYSQMTMDRNTVRTAGDQAALEGIPNSTRVMSIVNKVIKYDNGTLTNGGSLAPTVGELLERYHKDSEGFDKAAQVANSRRILSHPSVVGAAYYICLKIDSGDAEEFFVSQYINGIELKRTDPAWLLRERVERITAGAEDPNPWNIFRYMILAWNHYRKGNQLTKLQQPRGGWDSEIGRSLKFL
ncbi:MAG TPA: hypothetical protein VIY48_14035 [Candidatus Paceibacterota bacterium]